MGEANMHDTPTAGRPPQHEPPDVAVRWVLAFGAGLAALGLVVNVVVWWLFQQYTGGQKESQPWTIAPQPTAQWPMPPQPWIEGLQTESALRQPDIEAEARGRSYGWVDRQQQTIRIPLSEAIRMLAEERKLPARANPPSGLGEQAETAMPTASNSGRGDLEVKP
jgi:hypothetical protein